MICLQEPPVNESSQQFPPPPPPPPPPPRKEHLKIRCEIYCRSKHATGQLIWMMHLHVNQRFNDGEEPILKCTFLRYKTFRIYTFLHCSRANVIFVFERVQCFCINNFSIYSINIVTLWPEFFCKLIYGNCFSDLGSGGTKKK